MNDSALEYWRQTHFSFDDIDALCVDLDQKHLAMRVVFHGDAAPEYTITNRTGSSGEGHFPMMIAVINEVLETWEGQRPTGRLAMLLDDGIISSAEPFLGRAPLLTFGKSLYDHYSLLVPDP
ncbi:MAG: hypothetical protein KDD62_08140, partial [Bdellovibrionales bacterium]|nr:hypothetical protein [Bdellovibrionales bacterium]